jgi:hypothetical protein
LGFLSYFIENFSSEFVKLAFSAPVKSVGQLQGGLISQQDFGLFNAGGRPLSI